MMFSRAAFTRLQEKNPQVFVSKGCASLGRLAYFYFVDLVAKFPSSLWPPGSSKPDIWPVLHLVAQFLCTYLMSSHCPSPVYFMLLPCCMYLKATSNPSFKPGGDICHLALSTAGGKDGRAVKMTWPSLMRRWRPLFTPPARCPPSLCYSVVQSQAPGSDQRLKSQYHLFSLTDPEQGA